MTNNLADNWQISKSVLESNKYVLENQLYCDVTFVFNEENAATTQDNSTSAHKYMLITRSPVFCAMFTGLLKDESSEIKIEDVSIEAFKEMLKYIYFQKADVSSHNVLDVLYCAKKYMVTGLEKICRDCLKEQLDYNNACFILEQAPMVGEEELENRCLGVLDEYAEDALKSEVFTKISLPTVKRIIKRETLVVKEIDVFKACVSWAEAECNRQMIERNDDNKRKVLGDVFHLIRFPLLDQDTFTKDVLTTKLLLPEESVNVLLGIRNLEPHGRIPFLSERRAGPWQTVIDENLKMFPFEGDLAVYDHLNTDIVAKNISKSLSVLSIYYIKDKVDSKNFSRISVDSQSAKRINIPVKSKFVAGLQVYRADFQPSVVIKSNRKATVTFSRMVVIKYPKLRRLDGMQFNSPLFHFKGENGSSKLWHCLVGIKYRELSV